MVVLPIPASPVTNSIWREPCTTFAQILSISWMAVSRPTNGPLSVTCGSETTEGLFFSSSETRPTKR